MKVKIKEIENLDIDSFYLVFDYLGKERRSLFDLKVSQGLKIIKPIAIGDSINVIRNIMPSRKDPTKLIELFKITKVFS